MEAQNNNSVKDQNATCDNAVLSSRLFKFRAWNDGLKALSKPFSFGQVLNFNDKNIKSITDEIITQFTGMVDVNNREIYEGDIIKFTYNFHKLEIVGCVKFSKGGYFVLKQKGEDTGWNDKVIPYPIDKEIIGNIFENPESL